MRSKSVEGAVSYHGHPETAACDRSAGMASSLPVLASEREKANQTRPDCPLGAGAGSENQTREMARGLHASRETGVMGC